MMWPENETMTGWRKWFLKNRTEEECWEFRMNNTPRGYSRMRTVSLYGERRHYVYGHRFFWAVSNGRWPEKGEIVRHTCDNPPCVNPKHLEIGTQVDNMRDRDMRGRSGVSKLSEQDVLDIRADHATGQANAQDLAERYGVVPGTIRCVIQRKTWKWVN